MFSPSISLSKSPGSISTRAHGFSPIKMYSRAKSLDLTIAHSERKINPNYGKPDYVHSLSTFAEAAMDEMDIKRTEELVAEIKGVFNSMEDGEISPSAYDTAWVARIPAIDGSAKPQFPQLLDWILQNQLNEGSWGENSQFLACDRLLNTLSCLVTLALWGVGNNQMKRGLNFMRRNVEGMIKEALGHHQPKGFEMVFPVLLNEAKLSGLDIPYQLSVMKQIGEKRDSQLRK